MSRTLHLFGTDWGAMMVPIQVIRWYRMQCYDGTDSCAIVVPIRRYCQLIIFGPGVPQQQYAGLGMQVDVMPTLFGLMNLNYEYEGFGVDLLKQERPMVFYSADNQIVARDHQRCFVYNPSMNRSFCYDVLPNGNLKETKQESKFQDLKNYVFSNIQAAEYIERHQQ